MQPDNLPPNNEERLEQLPQDGSTPATPPQPLNEAAGVSATPPVLPVDDPRKDSDVDTTEANDVGVDAASMPGGPDVPANAVPPDNSPVPPSRADANVSDRENPDDIAL